MIAGYGNLFLIYSIGLSSICLISFLTYFFFSKSLIQINKKFSFYVFYSSILFYIFSILYLGFAKINALHHYLDFATHLEILWRNFQGLGLTSLMSEDFFKSSHWFSAHFTPITYLTYVPIFLIFPSKYIVPIAETFFILSALIPLWLISKKYFDENLARIFISSFLFYPTIFYINLYGIAYIELSIPLLLWLFYFLETKNTKFFFVILVLCLMIREEISLITSFFGLYMVNRKRYLIGSITTFISITYFYLVMYWIMPSFRYDSDQQHIASWVYGDFGSSIIEIIANIVFNPIETIKTIIVVPKVGNFIMYLIPLLFTPILSLYVFLIALPNLASSFLSVAITHSSFILYYLSPSIPIFFYGAVLSINKLSKVKFIKINLYALIFTIFISSLSTTVFFGATPISLPFWLKDYEVGKFYTTDFHYSAYKIDQNDIAAKKLSKMIPDNSVVSAEQHLLPLLYKKKKITVFPYLNKDTEFIFIDKFSKTKTGWDDTYIEFRNNPNKFYNIYFNDISWKVLEEINGVVLMKKNKKN